MNKTEMQFSPASGDAVWTAAQMHASRRWIYEVTPADVAALDRALEAVRARRLTIPFSKEQFPLGDFASTLLALRREMDRVEIRRADGSPAEFTVVGGK